MKQSERSAQDNEQKHQVQAKNKYDELFCKQMKKIKIKATWNIYFKWWIERTMK